MIKLTRLFIGPVEAIFVSVTAVRQRVADVIVSAEELIVRTRRRRLVTVLLVRVVVTVREEVAPVHLRNALGPVSAGNLAVLTHQRTRQTCAPTGIIS